MTTKSLATIAILALSTVCASAEKAQVKQDTIAAASLTINDCISILNGLSALDKMKPGDHGEPGVVPLYEFDSAGLRLDIAHSIAALTAAQREAQQAQQRIFYDVLKTVPEKEPGKPAADIPPGSPAALEYDKRLRELTDRPCGASITHINATELNLGKNQIPLSVLSALDKIINR